MAAAAAPDKRKLLEGMSVVITSRDRPLLALVEQAHRDLIAPTFTSKELEPVQLWAERLRRQQAEGPSGGFEFAVAMIVRDADGVALGIAAHEVYHAAKCGLVSYIVVAEELRGRGAAGALIAAAYDNSEALVRAVAGDAARLEGLFVDVLQVRDDHDDDASDDSDSDESMSGLSSATTISPPLPHLPNPGAEQPLCRLTLTPRRPRFASDARQQVYRRLGFAPLDIDLVFPGRMKGKRYNLAVTSRVHDPRTTKAFPTQPLLCFLEVMFAAILADSDPRGAASNNNDIDAYRRILAAAGPTIPMGEQFWK